MSSYVARAASQENSSNSMVKMLIAALFIEISKRMLREACNNYLEEWIKEFKYSVFPQR
jgi:hypothetical protein